MVVARPMSEVGFRGDHMATSSQSAASSSDSFRHCPNQTDAALHGKPALPVRPRPGRNPVTATEPRSSQALPSAPPMKPRPTSMILPSQSYAGPLRPQPLPPDRLGGPSSLGMPADQCEEENIVNDLLERTSSLAPRPSFPRPTIISPTHKATDHACGEMSLSDQCHQGAPHSNHSTVTKPTIISPTHKATDHAWGEMSLSDQCHQGTPRGSHPTATRPTIISQPRHQSGNIDRTQASHSGSRDGTQASSTGSCFAHDNNNDVSKKTQIRVTPFAKPGVAPKPQLAPKPGLRGVRPSNNVTGQESRQQLWPVLTASSVEKATAPVVEKGTKQSFNLIQKHTEKSVQKSIMTNIIKPHLGSSKFVQKATTPLVDKATKQMYASAEKKTEASVNKAIVSTVVGQQAEPSQTVQRTKRVLSGNSQALPTTFKDTKLTASSVERAAAPVVEKGTKQSFDVIQRHTEKSVQKSIMTNIIKPHLGSSKFVQKATSPLVDKATKQMYASAEKKTEASVNKAIVTTVVGQQAEPSQTVQRTKRILSGGNSQALPTTFKDTKLTASSVERATAPVVEKGTKQSFNVIQKHTEKSVQKSIMTNVVKPHLGSSKFVQKATTPLVDKATKQMYASAEKKTEASVNKAIVSTVVGPEEPTGSDKTQRDFHNNQARTPMSKSALSNSRLGPSALLHRSEGIFSDASTKLVGNAPHKHEAHGNQSNRFQTPRIIRVSAAQKGVEKSHSAVSSVDHDDATSREATNLTASSSAGRSMVNLAGLGSGKTAATSSEAPVARRRSIGNIRSKLSARPKSMNFDVLTTKRRDECRDVGRTQPSVVAQRTASVKKRHAPPRPSAGPMRLSSKSFSHPSRHAESSNTRLSVWSNKQEHRAPTTGEDVPHCIALFDYDASHPDELSFQSGDTVTLLRKVDDQWFCGRVGGKEGIFPSSFIDVLVPIPSDGEITDTVDYTDSREGMTWPTPSHPTHEYISGEEWLVNREHDGDNVAEHKVSALFTFVGEPGELSFVTGAAICVHGKLSSDWLYGELAGECGRFPASFVSVAMETLPQLDPTHVTLTGDKNREHTDVALGMKEEDFHLRSGGKMHGKGFETPGTQIQESAYCIAVHPFNGGSLEDLSFAAGDRIEVVARVNSDWLRGSLNGHEGIFPLAYVDFPATNEGPSSDVTSRLADVGVSRSVDTNITSARTEQARASKQATASSSHAADAYPEGNGSYPEGTGSYPQGSGAYPEGSGSTVQALFDYSGNTEDDLCFKAGEEIHDIEHINDDWMKGRISSRTGMFPSNFVGNAPK